VNPTIQAAINSAVNSLQEPEPVNVTKAGHVQFERTGSGDVQSLEIQKPRTLPKDKIDGNITGDAFDRLWTR